MKPTHLLVAAFLGLSTSLVPATSAFAQNTLTLMRGSVTDDIKLTLNRAVVMESETAFAELSVANPGVADVAVLSDRTIYVIGKSTGRTTLTLLGADGRLITNVEIQVAPDLAEFKERLKEILPKEKIEVRTANAGIVLSGTVSGTQTLARALELAERYAPNRVTNLLTVGGSHQVMLKVRFAEMNRSVAKELNASIGITGALGGNPATAATGTIAQGNNPVNLANGDAITLSNQSQGLFSYGFSAGGLAVNVLLEALETKGMVRTLAEPNLVAISGSEAAFLAGGELPVPTVADGSVGIEYIPFGINLVFTPTVLDDEVINLRIDTEVSDIDEANGTFANGIEIPAFTSRKAATTVQMRDGQSLAIAGLLRDDFVDTASQVPWIGDIPILGTLFRSSSYARNQTELVIIVTPHLVTPVNGDALVLPTDRVAVPSEADLFLFGKTAKTTENATSPGFDGSVASQDINGSYGYVLE